MLVGLLLAVGLARGGCRDVPGAEALWKPSASVVWVGEYHGTKQEPELFGDLVCLAGRSGRPIVVALERSVSEQAAWDKYLSSSGGSRAEAALLEGVGWIQPLQDGRGSYAMLKLARRLRAFKAEGRIVGVRMILPDELDLTPAQHEAHMAAAVRDATLSAPDALVLAYSGSAHALKTEMTGLGEPYALAASDLPPDKVVSVVIRGGPGSDWSCKNDGCGPHAHAPRGEWRHPRGIVETSAQEGADAIAYTGLRTTASPPARGLPASAAPASLLAKASGHR